MDILLDLDPISPGFGDAVFKNGPLTREGVTNTRSLTVAQRLRIRKLTFREEWFLDTSYGVPYYQEILGLKPGKAKVDQIFQEQILLEEGVKEITSYQSSFVNRKYSAVFRVRITTGEETEEITLNI